MKPEIELTHTDPDPKTWPADLVQVAMVSVDSSISDYDGDYREVLGHVTQWTAVTPAEFKKLELIAQQRSMIKGWRWILLVRRDPEKVNSVHELLDQFEKDLETYRKQMAVYERARLEEAEKRKAKTAERDRAKKLKMLEKLNKELGISK